MAETYYEYRATHTPEVTPSGNYTSGGTNIDVDSAKLFPKTGSVWDIMLDISGPGVALWDAQGRLWIQGGNTINNALRFNDIIIFDIKDSEGSPLSDVSISGPYELESDTDPGIYGLRASNLNGTYTFSKTDYTFEPPSFTFNNSSGHGAHVDIVATSTIRKIQLSSPADEDTDVLLQPLLQWSIGGDGATEGDLLDIYLRKDDANFTGDDLLAGLVDATLNSSLQVVAGLEYGATYYWQVQAFASEEDDLLSSSVFSFTVQTFSPPIQSVHPVSGLPTGENNQATIRRLMVAVKNTIFYEDI